MTRKEMRGGSLREVDGGDEAVSLRGRAVCRLRIGAAHIDVQCQLDATP